MSSFEPVTLSEAANVCEQAIEALEGPCDKCDRCTLSEPAAVTQLVKLHGEGWEVDPSHGFYGLPVYLRRCAACKAPRFPWAKRLDAERVRDWMQKHFEEQGGKVTAFEIAKLKHLTE